MDEVYANLQDKVKAGQPLFKLDSAKQEAAVETARKRIAELDAAIELAKTQLVGAEAQVREAQSAYQQAVEELETKVALQTANSPSVAQREIDKLENVVEGREAGVAAAIASKETIAAQIASVLPAQKASAQAQLAEAEVDLDKTTVRAGIDGILEQFTLRKGDVVNPMLRPAGVLVPADAGRWGLVAGFNQLEAQVMRVGMLAEVTCISKPMVIIPMIVTSVQDLIASGQIRAADQLIDPQQVTVPGTVTVYLEPLFDGGFDAVPPGSSCIANAYTSNHDLLDNEEMSTARWAFLHVVDTVGVVHAIVLRIQAILLPVKTLVFSGGH